MDTIKVKAEAVRQYAIAKIKAEVAEWANGKTAKDFPTHYDVNWKVFRDVKLTKIVDLGKPTKGDFKNGGYIGGNFVLKGKTYTFVIGMFGYTYYTEKDRKAFKKDGRTDFEEIMMDGTTNGRIVLEDKKMDPKDLIKDFKDYRKPLDCQTAAICCFNHAVEIAGEVEGYITERVKETGKWRYGYRKAIFEEPKMLEVLGLVA